MVLKQKYYMEIRLAPCEEAVRDAQSVDLQGSCGLQPLKVQRLWRAQPHIMQGFDGAAGPLGKFDCGWTATLLCGESSMYTDEIDATILGLRLDLVSTLLLRRKTRALLKRHLPC